MSEDEILNSNDFTKCLEIIEKNWNTDYGTFEICKEKMNNEITLELTTGGWSDNESFIDKLSQTWFWFLWWQESKRGGYYKFVYSEVIKYEEEENKAIEKIDILTGEEVKTKSLEELQNLFIQLQDIAVKENGIIEEQAKEIEELKSNSISKYKIRNFIEKHKDNFYDGTANGCDYIDYEVIKEFIEDEQE